jgi:hypothetical protein
MEDSNSKPDASAPAKAAQGASVPLEEISTFVCQVFIPKLLLVYD